MKYLLTLFFVSLSQHSFAEAPKIWFLNEGGFSRDKITDGKTTLKIGVFSWVDIRPLVHDNPEALKAAEDSSKYNTYAHLTFWIGLVPSTIGIMAGMIDENSGLKFASYVAFFGSAAIGMHYESQSRHFMWKGINIYNGVDNAKTTATSSTKVWIPLLAIDPISPVKSLYIGLRF